jgi:ABC-type transport system involved in cytochrome c biogenesis permease subunit
LAKYQTWLAEHKPDDLDESKLGFESFFNAFEPFYRALVLYVVAFVLVAIGWLGWNSPLNRAAFWLIVLALAVHTFALISRIYISGRPPVTNLYSSAVFIGWGGVVLGLVLEMVYRLGVGNVIASVAGFTTLLIANFLAGLTDGDTLGVLQAVLDTQFWLATHVVCETLGYTTTFIAGLLGLIYIVRGALTPSLSPGVGKDLSRMIYGTICFAMFFSFIGTVLGGLWADDSWGRFWGWDPKENGALMIVLWNALVLHARWGGIVKERGLAALAIGGNIITGWSWFGVNELGVGLHSYGFTDGVLFALGVFVATQLAVIALALLPKHAWWSFRNAS